MADSASEPNKETKVEHVDTEVSEVQEFGGGKVKSIEPVAEVHHDFHYYSGGQVVEHSSTRVSPWLWAFWAMVIVVIIGVLFGTSSMPFMHPTDYKNPGEMATSAGLKEVAAEMPTTNTPGSYIVMSELPLPAGQSVDDAVSRGSDLYQHYCIGCHGPNQDGEGPSSTSLNPKPRNLRDAAFMQAMSLQRINTSIHKGVPGTAMPRWENTITEPEIQDLIAYVFSLTAPLDKDGKFATAAEVSAAEAGVPLGSEPVPAPAPVAAPPPPPPSAEPSGPASGVFPSSPASINGPSTPGMENHPWPPPSMKPAPRTSLQPNGEPGNPAVKP